MKTDPALRRQINPQLEPGEWVYWAGKPAPLDVAFRDRKTLVLGLLTTLISFFVISIYPPDHIFEFAPFEIGLSRQWILLIFLVIIGYCFIQPVYQVWVATRTIYAITNRRAFTLKPTRKGPIVQSYKNIQHIERRDLPEGRGDLIFGTKRLITNSPRFGVRVHEQAIGFFGIDHVREVEQLMIKTFSSGTESDESL